MFQMKKQYDETFKKQCVELVIKEGRTIFSNFIRERTMVGKLKAREHGVKFGRKGKNKDLVDHAIDLWRTRKYTIKQIEKKTTVTKSTLYREIEKRGLMKGFCCKVFESKLKFFKIE